MLSDGGLWRDVMSEVVDVAIIVPTYREAENLRLLVPRIVQALSAATTAYEIIVVDDDSQDGTLAVLAELAGQGCPVRLITRVGERGHTLSAGERQRITVYDYDQVDRGMHFYNAVREAPEDAAAPECAMGCGRRHAPRVEKHDALATGSMLIRRDVFTRLVDEGIVKPGRWFSVEEGGTEDLYFCRQVAKLGIDVCVDWSVHCAHIGLFKM